MDTVYGQSYGKLYREHWWWRARESALLDCIRGLNLPGSPPAILDVGCGDGLFFDRLAQLGDVWGVESEAALVSPHGPWRNRIYTVPFDTSFDPGRRFSLILLLDVLEHIHDAESALRHALRLLAPGGCIVATVPAFNALWTAHDELNHHVTRYDRGSFRALAARAGMKIRTIRYFFHWLFPVKLLVRALEAVTKRPPQSPRLPPHWLNQTLMRVCGIERALTRRAPLPFGSSLLVVGEPAAHAAPARQAVGRA